MQHRRDSFAPPASIARALAATLFGLARGTIRGGLLLALASMGAASGARAQSTVTISMQAPPAAPRIGGAPVIGIRTGTPAVHPLAVTGARPMTFSATGLPAGL